MTESGQNNNSTKSTYYDKKKGPPADGCVGMLIASAILVVIGSAFGNTLSVMQVSIVAVGITTSAGILWTLGQINPRWVKYTRFAAQSMAWALFIFLTLVIVASVIQR